MFYRSPDSVMALLQTTDEIPEEIWKGSELESYFSTTKTNKARTPSKRTRANTPDTDDSSW